MLLYAVGVFWIGLHLIKLEIFPFYLYPMYSLPESDHTFTTYKITLDGDTLDLSDLSYRRFVYLHNTLNAYAEAVNSPDHVPDIGIIQKASTYLPSDAYSKWSPVYRLENLEPEMQAWLSRFFNKKGQYGVIALAVSWDQNRYQTSVKH